MNQRPMTALPIYLTVGGLLLLALGGLVACDMTNENVTLPLASAATATPMLYITPTPLFGLPGGDVLKASAGAAGTATRAAQLTFVPTWPSGVPREYPTVPPATPLVVVVPSQVAGSGIIYNADRVGVGVALDLPSQLGIFVNEWDAQISGQYIQVFAGTKSSPAESERAKGVVVVRITDSHYNTLDLAAYEPPLAQGVIRIVDAVGERLTLEATDGTRFTFDVATRQWVDPPTATPWYNNIEPTKRAAFEDMDRRLAEDRTAVALTPFPTPGGPTRTPVSQPSGFSADPRHAAGVGVIIEYAPAPFPAGEFNGQDEWYAELTDQRIAVYAGGEGLGAEGGDPMQGLLAVFVRGLDKHLISGPDFYQTPIKAGAVHVTAAVGERLTLEAADGTLFYFDVPTRQWVNP